MLRTNEEIAMFDDLDEIFKAYTALEIITVDGNGDLVHAAHVLCVINHRFKTLIEQLYCFGCVLC